MSKPHFFQKLAPMGVASLGAIAAIAGVGIAAAPAQAVSFGALAWEDGTSNFFDDVNPVAGDTFSVEFVSPLFTDDVTTVSGASGLLLDGFGPFPDIVDLVGGAPTGNFEYVSGSADTTFLYALTNDLEFNLDGEVLVTIGEGSTFLGDFDLNAAGVIEGVGFELDTASNATQVTVGGEVYSFTGGSDGDNFITGEVFTFGDLPETTIGGEYGGEISIASHQGVPEPGTILGLLAVGGLGIAMKRKQQSKQLSA